MLMPAQRSELPETALMALWRGLAEAGGPLIRSHLQSRAKKGKEDPARLTERFGLASAQRPDGDLVWLHAASVGEAVSVLSLIERTVSKPGTHVLLTTGTVTSATLMAERLPVGAIHQYVPFDRPSYVRPFLDHWRPDLGVWVESELWPNLIGEAHARRIPLALINARMSKKSHRGWQHWPGTAKTLLGSFDVILAQDKRIAERLHDLGALHARAIGNIKLAAKPLTCDEAELARMTAAIASRPVWCAASIHAREEAAVLEAHALVQARLPHTLTIIAPRQPDRGAAIADAARARGNDVAQRSLGDALTPETEIYIADTIGEMGLFFRLATAAFLGRSLVDKGGSNPMEGPPLGCAVVAGPHTDNFAGLYERLDRAQGVARIGSTIELAETIAALLNDPVSAKALAEAALTLVTQAHEVLDETATALENLMQRGPDAAA